MEVELLMEVVVPLLVEVLEVVKPEDLLFPFLAKRPELIGALAALVDQVLVDLYRFLLVQTFFFSGFQDFFVPNASDVVPNAIDSQVKLNCF